MKQKQSSVWGIVLFAVVTIGLSVYLQVRNYSECRAHDFSRFYCFTTLGGR